MVSEYVAPYIFGGTLEFRTLLTNYTFRQNSLTSLNLQSAHKSYFKHTLLKRDVIRPIPSDSGFCSNLSLNLFSNTHNLLFSPSCPLYSTPSCSTPPLSLYIASSIFFLPTALHLPTSPRFYLLN